MKTFKKYFFIKPIHFGNVDIFFLSQATSLGLYIMKSPWGNGEKLIVNIGIPFIISIHINN